MSTAPVPSLRHTKRPALFRPFSHLYIEEAVAEHPDTRRITSKFPKAAIISIKRYTELFNRPRQNWRHQKRSPALILAKRQDSFLYPGAAITAYFGERKFFYNTPAMNCVYDCDYCYLQGLYPSAHMVVFVNQDDYLSAARNELERGPMSLSISYDTDLLAIEHIAPWCSRWIEFAAQHPALELEIRTKSANYHAIERLSPLPNVILAWTISPAAVAARYESGAPTLSARLHSAAQAVMHGWQVRLCFDPILYVDDWERLYTECVEQTFSKIPAERVFDVVLGTFRMNHESLKRILKVRTDSPILYYPFSVKERIAAYPDSLVDAMTSTLRQALLAYLSPEKIHRFI